MRSKSRGAEISSRASEDELPAVEDRNKRLNLSRNTFQAQAVIVCNIAKTLKQSEEHIEFFGDNLFQQIKQLLAKDAVSLRI